MDKCGVGEGDCDDDYECKQGLFCGSNNCGSNNHDSDDCCQEGKTPSEQDSVIYCTVK